MSAVRAREGGSAAVELTLATPVLVLMLLFVVAAGRLVWARQQVDSAARQAARTASTAHSPQAAARAATAATGAALSAGHPSCRAFQVTVDTSAFRPGGQVTVDVTCTVALSDLTLLGVPGTRRIGARFTAPVDRFVGVVAQ
ncbi:MAG TPA: TadE family protein [Streptosporangiaceae bacterium]|jgi:Flp pilus assembly protein TadG